MFVLVSAVMVGCEMLYESRKAFIGPEAALTMVIAKTEAKRRYDNFIKSNTLRKQMFKYIYSTSQPAGKIQRFQASGRGL